MHVGDELLGRVVDGLGRPMDGMPQATNAPLRSTLGSPPDPRPMEHGHARGQEDLVLDGAPVECGVRPDEDCVANDERVLGGAAEHGVFTHDTASANHKR